MRSSGKATSKDSGATEDRLHEDAESVQSSALTDPVSEESVAIRPTDDDSATIFRASNDDAEQSTVPASSAAITREDEFLSVLQKMQERNRRTGCEIPPLPTEVQESMEIAMRAFEASFELFRAGTCRLSSIGLHNLSQDAITLLRRVSSTYPNEQLEDKLRTLINGPGISMYTTYCTLLAAAVYEWVLIPFDTLVAYPEPSYGDMQDLADVFKKCRWTQQ
jgi:hypothetical protein